LLPMPCDRCAGLLGIVATVRPPAVPNVIPSRTCAREQVRPLSPWLRRLGAAGRDRVAPDALRSLRGPAGDRRHLPAASRVAVFGRRVRSSAVALGLQMERFPAFAFIRTRKGDAPLFES
jgi:hypothetical protein